MDKKLIGFCTDCCEWLEVDDESGRGNCGHGRVACPPEDYRLIGPAEESQIRAEERERCAAVIRNRGNLYEAGAERHQAGHPNQQKARTKAGVAFRLANEVLNHGETDYVCVRRELVAEVIETLENGLETEGDMEAEHSKADRALVARLCSLLKEKEGQ